VNGAGGLRSVEIHDSKSSDWIQMERTTYNYWLAKTGGLEPPLSLRYPFHCVILNIHCVYYVVIYLRRR
jgi:hypothetical protein